MNRQNLKKILEAAVRAPSGDNVQPWCFNVSEDCTVIRLYNIPERDDSYFNYKQMASLISHGAVIENISIASQYFGYQANVELFPSDDKNYIAKITLEIAKESDSYLYSEIFTRCTNRFKYRGLLLSEENMKNLTNAVSCIDNVNLHIVYNKDIIKKLAKVLMINDRLVFEREDLHRFLFREIRWTKEQIEATKDGMPIGILGLNLMEKLFFPFMRFWWFVKSANYFGLSRVIGLKCWLNCRSASMLGMIAVDRNDKYGFVQAGRAMQRVWLEATRQGMSFQPIAGLVFLIGRLRVGALKGFSDKHREEIGDAEANLSRLFGIADNETMAIGFRIGQGPKQTIRTERKSV